MGNSDWFDYSDKSARDRWHMMSEIDRIYAGGGSIEIIVRDSGDDLVERRRYNPSRYPRDYTDEHEANHDADPMNECVLLERGHTLDNIHHMLHVCALALNASGERIHLEGEDDE